MGKLFSPLIARVLGGVSIALLLALGVQTWRASHWKAAFGKLHGEASTVLTALSQVTGRKVPWDLASGQIVVLGERIAAQRLAIESQNASIDAMAAEAVRLRARADELRAIAEKAEAQRSAALRRLGDMRVTPGTRSDCLQLLREAEEALDIVREASAAGEGE